MILDSHAEAAATAAFTWAMRDNRLAEMRTCINRLSQGQVLQTLRICRDLAVELERRHHELATGMVAMAALTPDALPEHVEGFAINGRNR